MTDRDTGRSDEDQDNRQGPAPEQEDVRGYGFTFGAFSSTSAGAQVTRTVQEIIQGDGGYRGIAQGDGG